MLENEVGASPNGNRGAWGLRVHDLGSWTRRVGWLRHESKAECAEAARHDLQLVLCCHINRKWRLNH